MDYDYRRPQQHPFYAGYWINDRTNPMSMAQVSRVDPRICPIGGPSNGLRARPVMGRDDGCSDTSPTRRRIAVACARCRKRKIRCSGDPGDGSGCQNCRQAGVDPNTCIFYRVGTVTSTDPAMVHGAFALGSGGQNPSMSIYAPGGASLLSRPCSTPQFPSPLNTKAAMYPQRWTIPCPEETSPVETYNLDQSAAYVSNANTLASVYSQGYGYNHKTLLQHNPYLDHDSSTSYTGHGLPLVNISAMRTALGTEPTSPLNMTSIQSMLPAAIPERPRLRQVKVDGTVPQRRLPMPQPSPAQSTRNTVDLMQDQRLRSAQISGRNVASYQGASAKPSSSWSVEDNVSDMPSASSSEASAADLLAHTTASIPATSMTEGTLGYVANSSAGDVTTTSAPQLNFSTSLLLDAMPAPAATSPYSNFRKESQSMLKKQASHTDLYSFSPDKISKKNSLGSPPSEAPLVSGRTYNPLVQPQPQVAGMGSARRDATLSRPMTFHRPATSTFNHNF
ncbi:hypothetical protein K491DRAFT_673017 [Lophiostoma macrostomum CBS 122681]|uniref:Zn(2)-C6 fungal-type domain-containing protein n=1 Tax=Lophiostoma macrostomum CBS 122681 TaxID=1314788 RepID=A0A6A6TR32_9PLEO|nr:hypothetical protein K491DRAFT_673017 [Lophiostoma macrostomum CBS 122681]